MRKTNIVLKLTIYLLIQAFIFTNACFACGISFRNNTGNDCLSPALNLGADELNKIYLILQQSKEINGAGIKQHKDNGQYKKLLERLAEEVGTADELLESIRTRYQDEFGDAIRILKEREDKYRIDNGSWLVEHQKEVMLMSYAMGKILGFSDHRLAGFAIATRFHDIGKCEVDPQVINDDRLFSNTLLFSPQERENIRNEITDHALRSYVIFKEAGIKDEMILDAVFYHHANVDGSGYPDPVTRQEIPLDAKIIRVVDSFSAMLGFRPYPRPFQQLFQKAVQEIEDNSYYFYGPRVVKTFQSMLRDGKITNRHNELYNIPLLESAIFRELLNAAQNNTDVYPFAKVASGISMSWNKKPYRIATNSIGVHRHAEVNLVLKVLNDYLGEKGLLQEYKEQLRRLEFLAYTTKLDQSKEALQLLITITLNCGNPFEDAVVYSTMRPCSSCLDFLALMGVRQIYYASEHQSPEFVSSSEKTVISLNQRGIKVAQAYFLNGGVIEPNELFFAFCNQPGYEKITATIDSWLASIINYNEGQDISVDIIKEKEREFINMLQGLLGGLDAQADLDEVNEMLIQARGMTMIRQAEHLPKHLIFRSHKLLMQAI